MGHPEVQNRLKGWPTRKKISLRSAGIKADPRVSMARASPRAKWKSPWIPNGCILWKLIRSKRKFQANSPAQGAPMESKSSGRRKFLKNSAALIGAAAAGIRPASGQAPAPDMDMPDTEALISYGQRSPFVKSKRISVMERMSPDEFGMTFHVLSPLQDSVGMITPSSLHYISTHRGSYVPNIDPAGTPAADSRDGGPAADFYGG